MSDPKNDSNGVTKRELASSVLLKEVDLEPFLELLQGGELRNLEEGEVHPFVQGASRVCADLEAVPADVREHGPRHRQREARERQPDGTVARETLSPPVRLARSVRKLRRRLCSRT